MVGEFEVYKDRADSSVFRLLKAGHPQHARCLRIEFVPLRPLRCATTSHCPDIPPDPAQVYPT